MWSSYRCHRPSLLRTLAMTQDSFRSFSRLQPVPWTSAALWRKACQAMPNRRESHPKSGRSASLSMRLSSCRALPPFASSMTYWQAARTLRQPSAYYRRPYLARESLVYSWPAACVRHWHSAWRVEQRPLATGGLEFQRNLKTARHLMETDQFDGLRWRASVSAAPSARARSYAKKGPADLVFQADRPLGSAGFDGGPRSEPSRRLACSEDSGQSSCSAMSCFDYRTTQSFLQRL